MKNITTIGIVTVLCVMFLSACGNLEITDSENVTEQSVMVTTETVEQNVKGTYTADTLISEVINDPVFGNYGRLIFPVNEGYYSGNTLEELQHILEVMVQ